jgi:hypothetical protein
MGDRVLQIGQATNVSLAMINNSRALRKRVKDGGIAHHGEVQDDLGVVE